MPLIVEIIENVSIDGVDDIRYVLDHAFSAVAVSYSGTWTCSVLITDSATISRLHEEFFDDASDTDVMSFPSGEDPSASSGYLGDIAVSLPVASIQAAEHQHSVRREVTFLALHGLLHLIGYDDDDPGDRQEMLDLQGRLLADYERLTGMAL